MKIEPYLKLYFTRFARGMKVRNIKNESNNKLKKKKFNSDSKSIKLLFPK